MHRENLVCDTVTFQWTCLFKHQLCLLLKRASVFPVRRQWKMISSVTRVNSTNILDEGLRIGGRGRRMNSKVKISQTRRVSRISVVLNLAQSQSIPGRPLLAPIYRPPGLKEQVGFNTNYSIPI
jgi:hypothetical protein